MRRDAARSRLGELLKEMPKAKGGGDGSNQHRKATGTKREPVAATPTYADLGLDKKTAAVAQQLANLDPNTRDAIALGEMTIAQAKKAAKAQVPTACRPF